MNRISTDDKYTLQHARGENRDIVNEFSYNSRCKYSTGILQTERADVHEDQENNNYNVWYAQCTLHCAEVCSYGLIKVN